MTKNTAILSANQEFFTIVATGESGVSIRGLSRLAGLPKSTVSDWFKSDLSGHGVPNPLKALEGKALYMSGEIKVRGKIVKAIRSGIAAEIIQYAAIDLQKPEAREALKAFIAIGLDSFIQGATGYLPEQYQSATKDPRYEIQRLVKEPNPWKRLYSANTCDRIRKWYFPKDFFWKFAYAWMTHEEVAFLDEHNPVIPGIWQRQERIFQHLSAATRDRLAPEIAALCTLIESSTSRQDFETRWARVHGLDQQEFINA